MNIRELKDVLAVQTVSHNDALMREYLKGWLNSEPDVIWRDDGNNIYAQKGSGNRPCVVAHMDTVHDLTADLSILEVDGKLFGFDSFYMRQTGCGGDDKVGIFIALQCLRSFDDIKVAFFRDEEVGCIGSSLVDKDWFKDVCYVLQCDRRGNGDFVTKTSVDLSSKAFQDDIAPIIAPYGYSFCSGMMTDVQELKEQGINVAMANMSCGYHNPHCDDEYVVIAEVWNTLQMVGEIIDTLGCVTYVHIAEPRPTYKFDDLDDWNYDRELNKWERKEKEFNRSLATLGFKPSGLTSTSLHDPTICSDCGINRAKYAGGVCIDCEDFYTRPANLWKKPDYGPVEPLKLDQHRRLPDADTVTWIVKKKKKGKKKNRYRGHWKR